MTLTERVTTLEKKLAEQNSRIQMLLDQNANLYNALKLTLQGRWQGEFPHAEAFCKAMNPDEAGGWSAVPFPKV